MANPATAGTFGETLVASTAEDSIILDPQMPYAVAHDGENEGGTARTDTIYLSNATFAGPPDADQGSDLNKIKLMANRAVVLAPGLAKLYFRVKAAGNDVTFTLLPGVHLLGAY